MGSPKCGRRRRRPRGGPRRLPRVGTTSGLSLSGGSHSASKAAQQPSVRFKAREEHYAASVGHVRWLQICLQKAETPTQADINGFSALHMAALHGRLDCIKMLVEKYSVNVDLGSLTGWRAIHLVLSKEAGGMALECLQYLIKKGADVNVQNHNGVSPLHKAASEGRENCIQPLVDAGADVHAKDADGQEPLDLCKMWGHKATAKCLRSAIWKREKASFAQEVCRLNEIKMECEARRKEFLIRQQAELDFCNHWAYNEWLAKKGLPLPSDRILGFLGSRRQSANLWKYVGKTSLPVPVPSPTSLDLEKRPAAQVPRKPHWAWNFSTNPSSAPATCIFRPNTIRIGVDPEKVPDPDFTSFLFLYKNAFGQPEIQIDNMEKVPFVPDLPFDVLEKSLYPRARHTRLEVPEDLRPRHLLDLKHRRPPGPEHQWTDQMAVSLRQTLDPTFLGTLKTHLSSYSDPKWLSPGPALDRAQGSETSSLLSNSSRREE
uniref:Ankyrin repeat domain-containing protein 53 isoform X1 n=1 Tax=Pogona vitticeps TaxID=103695 RepID=A0ABM5GKU9_9SAUR